MSKSKGGRPKRQFTPDQIDRAKFLLGRRVYPSRVAALLARKYALPLRQAYRLVGAAQKEVYDALRADGHAGDPLTAMYLYFASVVGDPKEKTRDRTQAANGAVKLLGLNKLLDTLGSSDAEAVLAGILQRQQAAKLASPARAGDGGEG